MKKIIFSAGIALLALSMADCDRQDQGVDYRVNISLDSKLRHDSATLLVLEEQYNRLRVCGIARTSSGTFTFTGQTDGPRVALIRWDNDSTQPFHFVLEKGETSISIKPGTWTITGSPLSSAYLHYINQRNSIMDSRVATWQEYLNMAADSSLKRDDELRMVRQDSLLNDSLQRLTVEYINRGDPVGLIIKERYAKQLDQQHMRLLEK